MSGNKDLFRINHRTKLPLYELIEQNFRELITGGRLQSGNAIPSEWELADLYGVSRLTVRRALDDLSRQGWLERRHGVGTFITNPTVTQITPNKLSFTEQMRAIGRKPSSHLVHIQVIPAVAELAARLKLQEGDPVIEIMRVRLADGEPVLLETTYLSQKRFPGLEQADELAHASLYETLGARYQTSVASMDQILEPVLLSKSEAKYLEAQVGTPAIKSEVLALTTNGDPIEYSWSVTRGDKCKFFFSFRRGEDGS